MLGGIPLKHYHAGNQSKTILDIVVAEKTIKTENIRALSEKNVAQRFLKLNEQKLSTLYIGTEILAPF